LGFLFVLALQLDGEVMSVVASICTNLFAAVVGALATKHPQGAVA